VSYCIYRIWAKATPGVVGPGPRSMSLYMAGRLPDRACMADWLGP